MRASPSAPDTIAEPSSGQAAPGPAPRSIRPGWIFVIVALGLFMSALDQTIVATALPAIQRELGADIAWSGWTITVYALGQVLVMPLAGRLSDIFGRKRVFLVATIVFMTASLGCGLAGNIYLLVALRGLQAIGGGALMPSASGIVAEHFGANRDRALGMFSGIFSAGAVVGPIVGGFIVTSLTWRDIFFVNIPLCILIIVFGAILIPAGGSGPGKMPDVAGIALLGGLVLSVMYAITYLGDEAASPLDLPFLVTGSLAVVLLAAFIVRARTARTPFIPFDLLFARGFAVMNLLNFFAGVGAVGFSVMLPVYATLRFDTSPFESGSLLTARAIATICISTLAAFALHRSGYRLPMMVGYLFMAGSLVATALVPDVPPELWLGAAGVLCGAGMGMLFPAANNAIMRLVPEQAAAIAGLRGMFRQAGAIVSISVATAVAARSPDPGAAFAIVFLVLAGLVVCVIPLVLLVPEHRGRW